MISKPCASPLRSSAARMSVSRCPRSWSPLICFIVVYFRQAIDKRQATDPLSFQRMFHANFWADMIALTHVGFSLFVLLGLILFICGDLLRWRWSQYISLRAAHFLCVEY